MRIFVAKQPSARSVLALRSRSKSHFLAGACLDFPCIAAKRDVGTSRSVSRAGIAAIFGPPFFPLREATWGNVSRRCDIARDRGDGRDGDSGCAGRLPAQPVTLVVPFPPGGVADIVAPAVRRTRCRAHLKTPVVIENKPGAGGGIGMGYVAQGEARRLHAAARAVLDLHPARSRQGHRPHAALSARPVRADRAAHRRSDGARGARRQPVEDAGRIRRRREGAAGRDHLRLVGQLRHDAHADGDARAAAPASSCCTCRTPAAGRRWSALLGGNGRRACDRAVDGDSST